MTNRVLAMTGATERSDLELQKFQAEMGELLARYRRAALAEMQIGMILQQMSEIGLRHGVPMPAELALTGKALAQVQLATAELDPQLDPFEVAGKFLMRSLLTGISGKLDPRTLIYESQKLRVRVGRVIEAVERLVGARPGPKLAVDFRANSLEDEVRKAGRRMTFAVIAATSVFVAGFTAVSTTVEEWVPPTFGALAALLTVGLIIDLMRRH